MLTWLLPRYEQNASVVPALQVRVQTREIGGGPEAMPARSGPYGAWPTGRRPQPAGGVHRVQVDPFQPGRGGQPGRQRDQATALGRAERDLAPAERAEQLAEEQGRQVGSV